LVDDVDEVTERIEAVDLAAEDEIADVVGLFVWGEAEVTGD
jgi:hypothetical protein